MLPVILFVSLFVVGTFGGYIPEPQKKVVEIPIPKAVTKHKHIRQDHPIDYHESVPIKRTEVRRVIKKVPLIHEVPIFVHKNKPFLSPVAVPRKIQVHEVVGVPVVHDKHVIQPVYIDRPYVVEKQRFVPQPYPVEKPVPIDFLKRITKVYDRKVEVPHEVPVPLVKTVDRPRPVPFTREVVQYYDVHVKVPRPVPVKLTKHVTHVEKVPFETPNVVVQKQPVKHVVNEYIPKVPQVHVQKFRVPSPKHEGFHGRVFAGTEEDRAATAEAERFGPRSSGRVVSVNRGEDMGVRGPAINPGPQHLATQFFDGRNGQRITNLSGGGAVPGRPIVQSGGSREGQPFVIGRFVAGGGGGAGGGGAGGAGGFGGFGGGAGGAGGFGGFGGGAGGAGGFGGFGGFGGGDGGFGGFGGGAGGFIGGGGGDGDFHGGKGHK